MSPGVCHSNGKLTNAMAIHILICGVQENLPVWISKHTACSYYHASFPELCLLSCKSRMNVDENRIHIYQLHSGQITSIA